MWSYLARSARTVTGAFLVWVSGTYLDGVADGLDGLYVVDRLGESFEYSLFEGEREVLGLAELHGQIVNQDGADLLAHLFA